MCKSKYEIPVNIVQFSEMNQYKSGVYVIENKNWPGIYKVGLINRQNGSILDRIKEQEKNQWVLPGSLRCLILVPTDKPELLEHTMHNDPGMIEYRCSQYRELFKMSLKNIFEELKNHSILCADNVLVVDDKSVLNELNLTVKKNTTKSIDELKTGKYIYNGHTPYEFEYNAETGEYSFDVDGEKEVCSNYSQFAKSIRANGWKTTDIYNVWINLVTPVK